MSEKSEITFMQIRLLRLASERWNFPLEKIIDIFKKTGVFGYIEAGYGIFHCEGDEAVLDDVTQFVRRKGISVNA